MKKTAAVTALRKHARALHAMGAASLYLFGSTARNRAKPQSDIDIFIDPDTSRPFTLIELVRIQDYLSKKLDAPVDLTTRNSLHPKLRGTIQATAVKVF